MKSPFHNTLPLCFQVLFLSLYSSIESRSITKRRLVINPFLHRSRLHRRSPEAEPDANPEASPEADPDKPSYDSGGTSFSAPIAAVGASYSTASSGNGGGQGNHFCPLLSKSMLQQVF
jgi:hypothetical protein